PRASSGPPTPCGLRRPVLIVNLERSREPFSTRRASKLTGAMMATRPGNATRYRRSTGAVASCAAAALLLTGCLHDRPRHRMGSLPFPGLLTNYKAADPERLGRHQYVHIRFEHGDLGPENGGIVYTCRAGFLDLVHLRATVDWTWYSWKRLHEAIDQELWSVHIAGPDLT